MDSLPTQPVPDSPLFRASLSSLDDRAHTLKKLSKLASTKAQIVSDLLQQLEIAEDELFNVLELLGGHLTAGEDGQGDSTDAYGAGGDASRHGYAFGQRVTGKAMDAMRGTRSWAKHHRIAERERLDTLVISKLRTFRTDIKDRHVGGGRALQVFDETSRTYYHTVAKHLAPHANLQAGEWKVLDAKQGIVDAEFEVKRYTAHSAFLWSAPPYSLIGLEIAICLYTWYAGLLPEVPNLNSVRQIPERSRTAELETKKTYTSPISPIPLNLTSPHSVPFPLSRERGLAHKGSLPSLINAMRPHGTTPIILDDPVPPAPSSLVQLKSEFSDSLSAIALRKDQLEIAWAQREDQQAQLELQFEARVQGLKTLRVLHPNPPSSTTSHHTGRHSMSHTSAADSSYDTSRSIESNGKEKERDKHKKGGGMGHRIRGMISSASNYGGLAAKASGNGKEKAASSSSSVNTVSLARQLSRNSASGVSSGSGHPHQGRAKGSSNFDLNDATVKNANERREALFEETGYVSPFRPVFNDMPSPQNSPMEDDTALMPSFNHMIERSLPVIRDLQMSTGSQVIEDEMARELAGRKREGVLWSPGVWEEIGASSARAHEKKDRGKWEKCWVVLASSKIYEFQDGLNSKPQHPHEVIDLRFASAREGRDTDRRFTFEVVTPSHGKRMYQAASAEDMKSWVYAIGNAVQSCLNGSATVKTFGDGRGTMDDLSIGSADPGQPRVPSGLSSRALKGMSTPAIGIGSGWHRQIGRRVSLKDALRQSRNSLGFQGNGKKPQSPPGQAANFKLPNANAIDLKEDVEPAQTSHTYHPSTRRSRSSLGIPNPPFLSGSSRHSSASSQGSSKRMSWISNRSHTSSPTPDADIRHVANSSDPCLDKYAKMAVIAASNSRPDNAAWLTEGLPRSKTNVDLSISPSTHIGITSSKSRNDLVPADMAMLRKISEQPGNQICADCKRPMKGEQVQRWATISLHGHPMVMFLCIRCAGIHRSLGTHISKIRSPDLDHWTDEMVLTARAWGNARGNAIWEREKPGDVRPRDDSLTELRAYIENKYVRGIWLSDKDREIYLGLAL